MQTELIVKVKRLTDTAHIPTYAHPGDAGLDVYADESLVLEPFVPQAVKTGIALELPPYTEAQLRPRSGLALKHAITLPNSPATIDQGYRGEIKVILLNLGKKPFTIEKGDRICQMVIATVAKVALQETDTISESERGSMGFGSSGR